MRNKQDAGKLQFRLLPWGAVKLAVRVLMFGAEKYSEDGWKHQKNGATRYLDAAFRHIVAHAEGEELDTESGLPHLAHAVCSLMFAMDLRSKVKEETERTLSIPREVLRELTGEEIKAIFEDHRQVLEPNTVVL